MMYFARWKALAIVGVCLLGVLISLPNLLPRESLPNWARQISLGLDLRGGSYLLLEVDTSVMVRERLETLVETTRRGTAAATPRILYTGLAANPVRMTSRASYARPRSRSGPAPLRSSPTSR